MGNIYCERDVAIMESKINERGAAVGSLASEAAPAATCSRWHCGGSDLRINTRIYVNVTSRTAVAFCAGTSPIS